MIFLDKTNGFIKEIIQPTSVNPDHRMFLISTVYMKARVHQTDASWRLKRVLFGVRWTLVIASWTVEASTSTKHDLYCFKKDPTAGCTKDFKWLVLNNVNMVRKYTKLNMILSKYFSVLFKRCCWWHSYRHIRSSFLQKSSLVFNMYSSPLFRLYHRLYDMLHIQ